MTIRDDLLTAGANLLIAVSGATDDKVIFAGKEGPRPAMPYVTIRLTTTGGGGHGPAERIDGLDGATPTATMQQRREAMLSFQGYGRTTYTWLDDLEANLDSPASLTQQTTDGISVQLGTGVADLSQLLDTAEETRCQLELRARYQYATAAANMVALQTTEVTLELERFDGDTDTLTADFALDAAGDLTNTP